MQTLSQFLASHPAGGAPSTSDWGNNNHVGVAPKVYKPHSILCRQDDENDTIFIVKSGWCLLYRELPDGERQILDTPLAGDTIGLRSMSGPRFASLMSITEVAVYEISARVLLENFLADGDLARKITRSLARLNAILAEHLVNIGRRNAICRTAHFLLELDKRLTDVGLSTHEEYDCPLTQNELADILGMTPVHVNRTLRELRKADLVSFKSGHVKMFDRRNLIKLSGFEREYLT